MGGQARELVRRSVEECLAGAAVFAPGHDGFEGAAVQRAAVLGADILGAADLTEVRRLRRDDGLGGRSAHSVGSNEGDGDSKEQNKTLHDLGSVGVEAEVDEAWGHQEAALGRLYANECREPPCTLHEAPSLSKSLPESAAGELRPRASAITESMTQLDHIALVVPQLEPVLARLDHVAGQIGPVEAFPSEGTREVYVGEGAAKLLLMEPTSSEGPYARALAKRGPGLHHVALHTPDLAGFLGEVRGWLLLPASAQTIANSKTAWLARPGVPTLLEVHEAPLTSGEPLVSAVELPAELGNLYPTAGLTRSPDEATWLTIGGVRMSAQAWVAELS